MAVPVSGDTLAATRGIDCAGSNSLGEMIMEVKRQRCQSCGSIDVRNILVRSGRDQIVYVRCSKCEQLVARYELKDYYHHGKGMESYLRAHGASGGADSGRAWLEQFNKSQEQAVSGYEAALEALRSAHKEI
jgi:hypothetical protein